MNKDYEIAAAKLAANQAAYEKRQDNKGFCRVKLWIPKEDREDILNYAHEKRLKFYSKFVSKNYGKKVNK